MIRALGIAFAFVATIAALVLAPATLGFDHPGEEETTPQASPEAGHREISMSGTGAAYMVIRNAGAEADRLVAGTAAVSEVVEIHEIVDVEGVMEMRPLAEGVEIPAGGEATLEPGGYHIMLVGLMEDLTDGMTFDLTLEFERAGDVVVPVAVRPQAEPAVEDPDEPVTAGEITIENAWSRPAPALGVGHEPEATPTA